MRANLLEHIEGGIQRRGWGEGERENNEQPQGIKKIRKGETPIWLIEFEHSLSARPE